MSCPTRYSLSPSDYIYMAFLSALMLVSISAAADTTDNSATKNQTLLEQSAETYTAIEQPKAFNAEYKARFNGIPVTATRELKKLANGQQELRFSADSWLAKIEEFSQFKRNKEGQLVPLTYEYHRTGMGKDRHALINFDWTEKKVTNNVQKKAWVMDLPENTLDKLSYQVQLQQDLINEKPVLDYTVADGGRIKHYIFETLGEEILDTPIGKFQTVKIKRTRKNNNKRITYLWLAKNWNYLVVRIQQQELKGKPYEIILSGATVDGKKVKGF